MASLLLLLLLVASSYGATSKTHPSDASALRAFKNSINPNSINPWSCVASWNFVSDPCRPESPTHFTCGIVCNSLGNVDRIVAVTLDPAGYSGTLDIRSLSQLSLVAHLDLFDNKFYGSLPEFPALGSLQTLVLASNSFTGAIPVSISRLSSLETLDLSRNQLAGSIPNLDLPNLSTLDMSFNRLSGYLPASLPVNLVTLSLRGNFIDGYISKPSFSKLKLLEIVELGANRIRGKLQGWFFLLPSLQQVDLANNSLTAVEAWGPPGGDRLVAVDVSFNRIAGALPAALAEYPSLVALSARGNRLTGEIPWQYHESKKGAQFRRLYLDGNFLNGKAPAGFLARGDEITGSFGDNCLQSCPGSATLCSPSQKPEALCKEVYGLGQRKRPARPGKL